MNGAIADPLLTRLVFSDVWLVAMATLVPLICLLSVLLGIVVSSRVNDPRTAQQIGGFVVIPIIAVAVAQFLGGQATFTMRQVVIGDLIVAGLIGLTMLPRLLGLRPRVDPDPPGLRSLPVPSARRTPAGRDRAPRWARMASVYACRA